MEKDIVIEQLRSQLKQLRSKLAVMEEEQAADTAPLQGLLNQLGELKVITCTRGGGSSADLFCRTSIYLLYCRRPIKGVELLPARNSSLLFSSG